MARLIPQDPFGGLLPLSIGGVTMRPVEVAPITSVAPFAGQTDAASEVLVAALGVAYPAPNRVEAGDGVRLQWVGLNRALLIGAPPPEGLGETAALTDQSDAVAVALLSGAGACDVLARLVPVDLRQAAFGDGATVRTLLGHMAASISRAGPDDYEVMVMRSMAGTLVEDVRHAMQGVAARG